ncbi:hypothetical protein ANCDUO_19121 [Ancylostoma duodenale]|uniref:Uncharacterized protein n=1 Tax=Ancylostoma duodenale TaxID=51022 RepID=A0A0C2CM23_9BILA|nr:hypothetical protein ANCDUO_19121 [Ancylostoma duodenale]
MRSGRNHHHATLAPRNIGEARWMRRVAIVACACLIDVANYNSFGFEVPWDARPPPMRAPAVRLVCLIGNFGRSER